MFANSKLKYPIPQQVEQALGFTALMFSFAPFVPQTSILLIPKSSHEALPTALVVFVHYIEWVSA